MVCADSQLVFRQHSKKAVQFPSSPTRWGKKALEEFLPAKTGIGRDQIAGGKEKKNREKGSEIILAILVGCVPKYVWDENYLQRVF